MKKKILGLVFISILALLPIKVNAEEVCEVYKNYYFLHDAIQQWNQAIQEACADENGVYDEDTINNCNKTINVDNTVKAYFDYDIPENATITGKNWYSLNDSTSAITLRQYHDIWEKMLGENPETTIRTYYSDPNNPNKKYFLHYKYNDSEKRGIPSIPVFLSENADLDRFDDIMDTVWDEGYVNNMSSFKYNNYSSSLNSDLPVAADRNYLTLTVNRKYSFVAKDLTNCMNIMDYQIPAEGTNYTCIFPSVYVVKYEVCEENEESTTPTTKKYHINYYANNNTDKMNSVQVTEGLTYKIKNYDESPLNYVYNGYTFVGWSTSENATEPNITYNPGESWKANSNLDLYAVWVNNGGGKVEEEQSPTGLGYSIGILAVILTATAGGVVYFKKRNKFENI